MFIIYLRHQKSKKPIITILTSLFLLSACSQTLQETRTIKDNKITSTEKIAKPARQELATLNNEQELLPKPIELDDDKSFTFQEAANYVLTNSDKLMASQAAWEASKLKAEALDDLRKPLVVINGTVGRYYLSKDVSTDGLKQRLKGYGDHLARKMSGVAQQIPSLIPILSGMQHSANMGISRIPDSINFDKYDNFSRADVVALMPLYTGGRINAIQQYAHSQADFHKSELISTEEELFSTLIKRYFQVQLAQRVVDVRKLALDAVKGHNHAAKRMLETGLISKVQYLQAATALADAKFQLEKSEDNLHLAQRALNSLLHSKDKVSVVTKLFVNNMELPPLETFQSKALSNYPALAKIDAKSKQAQAMKTLSNAAWLPNISAFGSHQIGEEKNWAIGINAQWTLHSSIDRRKMQQAADKTISQVNAVRRQAKQDINLLVEKNWLATNDAKHRFKSLKKEEELAMQVLKLQQAGFKEGLNTVIDVNDAHARLVQVRTQQANAAYEYVIALSELLASTGNINSFVDYIPNIDGKLGMLID